MGLGFGTEGGSARCASSGGDTGARRYNRGGYRGQALDLSSGAGGVYVRCGLVNSGASSSITRNFRHCSRYQDAHKKEGAEAPVKAPM